MFNEREIIPKVINGDLKAFDLLVKQYERLVYYVIFKLVDNREDAEDICQEVFMKVHRSIKDFGYKSKLSTWIARIAYTMTVNHLRKSKSNLYSAYPDNVEDYHFTTENPEVMMMQKDSTAYVNRLIAMMPLHYKTVLTLYHLNEFSYQEIEEITGMTEGTIKSHLFRGRKLLKEKLEQYLNNENYEKAK